MAQIDIRTPIHMREISEFLLKIAKEPLEYVNQIQKYRPRYPGHETGLAADLGRNASAAVISNCVIELWSSTVCYLHALEPDFPLYPKEVIKFIEETRLPFLAYVSLYYSLCKTPFEGKSTFNKIKIIVGMRNALQHDRPEESEEYSQQRIDEVLKWRKRIEPLVGKEALLWLPRVRQPCEERVVLQNLGEPPIMKFMKYPVAKWALDSTVEITKEMNGMLLRYKGKVKLAKEPIDEGLTGGRFSDPDLQRLWCSGE